MSSIELAIVMALIGIFPLIIMPQFQVALERAKVAAAKSDLKNFQLDFLVYHARYDFFPLTSGTPWQDLRKENLLPGGTESNAAPRDPWGNEYHYVGTIGTFMVISNGSDGKDGTSDDILVSETSADPQEPLIQEGDPPGAE